MKTLMLSVFIAGLTVGIGWNGHGTATIGLYLLVTAAVCCMVWLVVSMCAVAGQADDRIAAMTINSETSRLGPRPVRGEAPQPPSSGSADPAGNTLHIVHSSVPQPSGDAHRGGPGAAEKAGPHKPRSAP